MNEEENKIIENDNEEVQTISEVNNETQTVEVELKASDNLTVTKTPLHTFDWYVKWISSFFAIVGIFMSANNLFPYNIIFQTIGLIGWMWVGILWNDRALIILNTAAASVLAQGIFQHYLNGAIQ